MPQYMKSRDGSLIEVPKNVEAERTTEAFLGSQGYEPPEPKITPGALALLTEHGYGVAEYDGPATGADGKVVKRDVEGWLPDEAEDEAEAEADAGAEEE